MCFCVWCMIIIYYRILCMSFFIIKLHYNEQSYCNIYSSFFFFFLQTFFSPVHHILQANNTLVSPAPPRIIHLCLLINWCVESDVLGAIKKKILKCALQGGFHEQNWENADLLDILIHCERKWLPSICIREAIRILKRLLFVVLKCKTLQSGSVCAVKWCMTRTCLSLL